MFSGVQRSAVTVIVMAAGGRVVVAGGMVAVTTIYSVIGVGATVPQAARTTERTRLIIPMREVVVMMDPLSLVSLSGKIRSLPNYAALLNELRNSQYWLFLNYRWLRIRAIVDRTAVHVAF